jgi:membrane-bound ClpP family serine protease
VDGADGANVGVADALDTLDVASNAFDNLKLFTFQGWMAFLSIGSWSGLYAHYVSNMVWVGILVGLVAGFAMMFICAWVIRALFRLQSSGTVNMKKAIGCIGEVYLTVPPKETGCGKINVVLNGGLREYDAICLDDKPIEYGVRVRVVGMTDDEVMVVQRESEELA